ncbi:MAG: hypothetical protein EXR72_08000 [Myxococcales bacterium]|nr:hypothetical protein [Myxococcales bacterium]
MTNHRMRTNRPTHLALCLGASLLVACGSGDSAPTESGGPGAGGGDPGGSGLGPSGAQDFGRFKGILDQNLLPGEGTLDQIGFFAEHKIGTPPTACGGDVCSRAELGSMGNLITGSNCTLIHLALGTPIDPKTRQRPILDVAVVVDVGSKTLATPQAMADLRAGIGKLLDGLVPGDSVTLVAAGTSAQVLASRTSAVNKETVRAALSLLAPSAGSNLYEGMRAGLTGLGGPVVGRHRRLILVSEGKPTVGITTRDRLVGLVRAFAEEGGGVTLLVLGLNVDGKLLQAMADLGAGALYTVGKSGELPSLFEREVGYSLIPIAEKVRIRVAPGQSWRLREVFGIKGWSIDEAGGTIDIPALFVAWRKSAAIDEGRRGGGGGILIEVLPRASGAGESPSTVGDLEVGWAVPGSGEWRSQKLTVVSQDAPGQAPQEGSFAAPAVEKGFVVLNLYVAFRLAAQRAASGDLRSAHDVLAAVRSNAMRWVQKHPDPEIEDDLRYVAKFLDVLESRGALKEPPRAGWFNEPWPRD